MTPAISTDSVYLTVVAALKELGCDVAEIAPVHQLYGDLGMDSTELVELGLILRERLGLAAKIDVRSVKTVSDLVAETTELLSRRPR